MTGTEELFIQLGELRRHELRRLIAISAAAHLVVVAVYGFSPESKIRVPRGVISVELVRAPAAARPTTSAPVAKPVPPKPVQPKPVPPKPKTVVLPAEPTTPKVKPKVVKPEVVEKPAPEQELEDVLAQMRAESGEEAPLIEVAKAAPTAIGPAGSPTGVAISPEVARWLKSAKIHVRKNWKLPPGFRTQALEAHVEVNLDASGAVLGKPKITRRSGNPWYDEGVVRAIQKASPLPAPPESGKWSFVFLPEDSY
ncbi:MAG: TonB C-terminal domain-containing protein [Deltaproteobacteria bacterium]|nr:TonB C-terminal domain-containing protein [Deltaproteobacteria bacterium]MBW2577282.1 TonB C-terminal domain-containing protein [Deltaproteobacteria bacterium]MBW2692558.1 TonB C-terminal domain-containing protein [Deltaproteobacteria bacterium]